MAWYLEASPDGSFDRLAAQLGASSPANWRRLLRKLTGLIPSTLRTGAVDTVVAAWVEQREGDASLYAMCDKSPA